MFQFLCGAIKSGLRCGHFRKVQWFQFLCGAIKRLKKMTKEELLAQRFNSCVVRLKVKVASAATEVTASFNSCVVRLKVP